MLVSWNQWRVAAGKEQGEIEKYALFTIGGWVNKGVTVTSLYLPRSLNAKLLEKIGVHCCFLFVCFTGTKEKRAKRIQRKK